MTDRIPYPPQLPPIPKMAAYMTLRDYFAAQALAGVSASFARVAKKAGETPAQADARWSYERADAMLAEREKRNG